MASSAGGLPAQGAKAARPRPKRLKASPTPRLLVAALACYLAATALCGLIVTFGIWPPWQASGFHFRWDATWYGFATLRPSLGPVIQLLAFLHAVVLAVVGARLVQLRNQARRTGAAVGRAVRRWTFAGGVIAAISAVTVIGETGLRFITHTSVEATFAVPLNWFEKTTLFGAAAALPLPWLARAWAATSVALAAPADAPVAAAIHPWACPGCTRTYMLDRDVALRWRCPQCR